MPTKREKMRVIREILQLHYEAKLSQRQIARVLNIGVGSVPTYLTHLCQFEKHTL